MRQFVESAVWSAGMLAFFAVLMTGGFWLRHGHWVWERLA